MMASKQLKSFFTIGLFLLPFTLSHAGVISADNTNTALGNGNSADLQNLEWLSFDQTLGQSRDQVETAIDTGGALQGWRYASRVETETLLTSLWGGLFNGFSGDNGPGASWFLNTFGSIAETATGFDNLRGINFFFGNGGECRDDTSFSCRGEVRAADNYGADWTEFNVNTRTETLSYTADSGPIGFLFEELGTDMDYLDGNWTWLNSDVHTNGASLLVWDSLNQGAPPQQSIPEPSAIALMGLGLLGFGLARRKIR
ncbi:MAG: PEP-CTERM sorting domain-containing protein [gamma proteobacterium symbiont of Bathyaustriella thionipta]|nr:PEP-CTERM sorting domain-containing protein [gamma proteobacterium symbiont of Bathyaustriella thionipta]MCU7951129.1 PEP-CTERM sorting domain-containing protein [gamma proteobacterium symbiont of Bathyaustriella thionipta]MCU7953917.1 PEP-CTERM sorting domain-containing protein [gamma proteobacterium symbiont of Bathyaustriella thionipta]MCU7957644.1 PEP-CTERM sorting domain-containing protein [gamma proteobacterium symbiont of Bathyaustriella thionipta]MCU7967212.1 PEP-CTERM sorting domain